MKLLVRGLMITLSLVLTLQVAAADDERTEATVAPDILNHYVGRYELMPNVELAVTHEGGTLIVQITGQQAVPIYAESEKEFFYKVVDAQISFVVDSKGATTHLILHQEGRNLLAKKAE